MFGAAAGDIIGAEFEWRGPLPENAVFFGKGARYTDDTVCTAAIAKWILDGEDGNALASSLRSFCRQWDGAYYGAGFRNWVFTDGAPAYGSFANGSAMRVSAAGWLGGDEKEVLELARTSAVVTHNHPEGIAGAEITALAIYMARNGVGKDEICQEIESRFPQFPKIPTPSDYPSEISSSVRAFPTVLAALSAFRHGDGFDDILRIAMRLHMDSDTVGAIAGSIAEAYEGGLPEHHLLETKKRLPREFVEIFEAVDKVVAARQSC